MDSLVSKYFCFNSFFYCWFLVLFHYSLKEPEELSSIGDMLRLGLCPMLRKLIFICWLEYSICKAQYFSSRLHYLVLVLKTSLNIRVYYWTSPLLLGSMCAFLSFGVCFIKLGGSNQCLVHKCLQLLYFDELLPLLICNALWYQFFVVNCFWNKLKSISS